jgi:hypothetical protein
MPINYKQNSLLTVLKTVANSRNLQLVYIVRVMKLMEYVESKEDPLIQIVRTHQHDTN